MSIRYPDVHDEDIIRDYREGMSFRQLSKKYRMGVKSIAFRLKRNNIEQREGSQEKGDYCPACGNWFTKDVWSKRVYCQDCKEKIRIGKIKATYTKKMAKYKYRWGSYILEGIRDLIQEVLEIYAGADVIPLSAIYEHLKQRIGCKPVDPVIRRLILDEMKKNGYLFEKSGFRKK